MKRGVELIRELLDSKRTAAIMANCSVSYNGRAKSYLEKGDRLIVIKADSTILVHQPAGSNPINYMKQDTQFVLEGNVLHARNAKEFLDIEFHEVYSVLARDLKDGHELEIHGTERQMSDMLYSNPEMIEKGFKPLSREEHTKYGFIDLFGYDSSGRLAVVECKRYSATLDAVTQLRRYVEKIASVKGVSAVRGILAAPNISPNAKKMLEDYGYSYCRVEPPKHYERHKKDQASLDNF